jgi:hypothetical protein
MGCLQKVQKGVRSGKFRDELLNFDRSRKSIPEWMNYSIKEASTTGIPFGKLYIPIKLIRDRDGNFFIFEIYNFESINGSFISKKGIVHGWNAEIIYLFALTSSGTTKIYFKNGRLIDENNICYTFDDFFFIKKFIDMNNICLPHFEYKKMLEDIPIIIENEIASNQISAPDPLSQCEPNSSLQSESESGLDLENT